MSQVSLGKKEELNLGVLLEQNPHLQKNVHEYNINVTSNDGQIINAEGVMKHFIEHDVGSRPIHLYFHIPLCSYICHFCNYVKTYVSKKKEQETLEMWADLLIEESRRYLAKVPWLSKVTVESFYLGGGTAALLLNNQKALTKLMKHVKQNYTFSHNCELTIEGNPDNFKEENIDFAIRLGFNRFSVGIQTFQNEVNAYCNRQHSDIESLQAIDNLNKTGLPYSVDIMFGLPFQTIETVKRDFKLLIEKKVPSISLYRLRNADREQMGIGNCSYWNRTSVHEKMDEDGLFPSLEETYEMRENIVKTLLDHGYFPSPCSWWNKPDMYPDGNIPQVSKNKWQNYDTMIAFGPGAYGWLNDKKGKVIQTHNPKDIEEYVHFMKNTKDDVPLAYGRKLVGELAVGASLGFNFKSNQPIEFDRYKREFGIDLMNDQPYKNVFEDLLKRGFMKYTNDRKGLIPTLTGEALHEEIIFEYFHKRVGGSNDSIGDPLFVCNKVG